VLLFMPDYAYRISTLFRAIGVQTDARDTKTLDASMRGRATENLAALKIFADHPLLGVGPGLTHLYTAKYGSDGGLSRLQGTRQAHNMYLGVLSDLGIVGFVLFLSIFIVSIRRLLQIRSLYAATRPEYAGLAIGLVLAIVAFMASAVFLSSAYERFYWMMLALAGAASHMFLESKDILVDAQGNKIPA
jgi:putative inorganic carbon (HCO3(-)) transporter